MLYWPLKTEYLLKSGWMLLSVVHNAIELCPPAAATSRARLTCSWPLISRKSVCTSTGISSGAIWVWFGSELVHTWWTCSTAKIVTRITSKSVIAGLYSNNVHYEGFASQEINIYVSIKSRYKAGASRLISIFYVNLKLFRKHYSRGAIV